MIGFLVSLFIFGLIVGGLGRLAIPGRDPMGLGMTALVGVGGSILGGLAGRLLGFRTSFSFLLAVAGSALLVWLIRRGRGTA